MTSKVTWSLQHLQDAHGLAMRDHQQVRSVAVVMHNANDTPTEVGSGTCIKVGDRHFVATAGHVIKEAQSFRDIAVAAFGNVGKFSNETPKVIATGFRDDDEADAGWVELEPKAIPSWTKNWTRTFVTLDRLSLASITEANAVACLYGQPAADLKVEERLIGLDPLPYFANVIPPPAGMGPGVYVRYERDMVSEGQKVPAPAAPGMSGAGVYLMNQHAVGVWTPDVAPLVAIQRSWCEFEWLRCTPIRYWLELVRADCPDLASVIDPVLA